MSKGKTRSKYSLSERRRLADRYYLRGDRPADVARKLNVSYPTACNYYDEFKRKAKQVAKDNPDFVRDVLANTIQMTEELDLIRAAAWSDYDKAKSPQAKQGFMNIMLKAQDQRSKLLGVFGVKQEFLNHVQQVSLAQGKLIQFMASQLCPEDREKLEQFIVQEFREILPAASLTTHVVDAEVVEEAG